jgi:hypothetical protein
MAESFFFLTARASVLVIIFTLPPRVLEDLYADRLTYKGLQKLISRHRTSYGPCMSHRERAKHTTNFCIFTDLHGVCVEAEGSGMSSEGSVDTSVKSSQGRVQLTLKSLH